MSDNLTDTMEASIITSATENVHPRLSRAKRAICYVWPFARDAIMSMKSIRVNGLGCITADKHWNIYYDPEFVENRSEENITTILLRQLLFLLHRYPKRCNLILGDSTDEHRLKAISDSAYAVSTYLLEKQWEKLSYEARVKMSWSEMFTGSTNETLCLDDEPRSIEKTYRLIYKEPEHGREEDDWTDSTGNPNQDSRGGAGSNGEGSGDPDSGEQSGESQGEIGGSSRSSSQAGGSNGNPQRPELTNEYGNEQCTPHNGQPDEPTEGCDNGNGSSTRSLRVDSR